MESRKGQFKATLRKLFQFQFFFQDADLCSREKQLRFINSRVNNISEQIENKTKQNKTKQLREKYISTGYF